LSLKLKLLSIKFMKLLTLILFFNTIYSEKIKTIDTNPNIFESLFRDQGLSR